MITVGRVRVAIAFGALISLSLVLLAVERTAALLIFRVLVFAALAIQFFSWRLLRSRPVRASDDRLKRTGTRHRPTLSPFAAYIGTFVITLAAIVALELLR